MSSEACLTPSTPIKTIEKKVHHNIQRVAKERQTQNLVCFKNGSRVLRFWLLVINLGNLLKSSEGRHITQGIRFPDKAMRGTQAHFCPPIIWGLKLLLRGRFPLQHRWQLGPEKVIGGWRRGRHAASTPAAIRRHSNKAEGVNIYVIYMGCCS